MKSKVTRYYRRAIRANNFGGVPSALFFLDGILQHADKPSYDLARIEGSALWQGKPIAFFPNSDFDVDQWKHTPHAHYGLGNKDNPLTPWVYCAADQDIHPYGTRLYVENLVGRTMPGGHVHNGLIYVADVGGAIKGEARFDWMTGTEWLNEDLPPDLKSHDWEVEAWPPYRVSTKVKDIQSTLLRLGFWVGGSGQPDGVAGPKTRKSLLDFQAAVPDIPAIEFGRFIGPVTLYYLGQAIDRQEYLEEWVGELIGDAKEGGG